jgi:hypothetical protein
MRKFLRNRTLVLTTVGVLVLGVVFAAYMIGKNHSDASALPANTSITSSSSNQKVEGVTTSVKTNQSNSKNNSNSQTNKTTSSNGNSTSSSGTSTPKSNTSTTPSSQQQSGGSSTGGSGGTSTPTPPVQPTITFSADACSATASNAAGYAFELDVQDGPTIETSGRGAGITSEIIPASGVLTLSTGSPFTEGSTYSVAKIKDSLGNIITQKIVIMSATCS